MTPVLLPVGQNGTLIYLQTDRFKSELLSLSFALPLSRETAQKNAMVMALSRRGTVGFPTREAINLHLDNLYSTAISTANRPLGDRQQMTLSADFLGARYVGGGLGLLPDAISMLAELLRRPLLEEGCYRESYVSSEKQILRDAIRAAINDPRAYASMKLRKLLCGSEPYGLSLIGEEEDIATLTPQSLAERYFAMLKEIAPVFCYVGATPATDVAALLENAFAGFGGAGTPYVADAHAHRGGVLTGEETMPLQQGKLVLGFRSDITPGDPLAPALVMMNEIYGASPASKLFLNVREKRSLCYHCSSSLELYKGLLYANCGMKPENRGITQEAMLEEFQAIGRGEISKTEFRAAARSLQNGYRSATDSPAGLCRFYTARYLAGAFETLEDWSAKTAAVTKDMVVEAAGRMSLGATFFLNGKGGEDSDEDI